MQEHFNRSTVKNFDKIKIHDAYGFSSLDIQGQANCTQRIAKSQLWTTEDSHNAKEILNRRNESPPPCS
ncbi:hypothetical protein NTGM5_240003 [Candidatus Nitrotoga sp. M5]|nr:hypothetical protein NTGM5_240003 [Candidatus Nitrotoga sp. M5]